MAGCGREVRQIAPDQPQSDPDGAGDPRISFYEANDFQVSQGGRYALWYGCENCHGPDAAGVRDLADDAWTHGGAFDQVYGLIAAGHPAGHLGNGARVPTEQLWQIAAYVRSLNSTDAAKRRRQSADQRGEPQAAEWPGPVR